MREEKPIGAKSGNRWGHAAKLLFGLGPIPEGFDQELDAVHDEEGFRRALIWAQFDYDRVDKLVGLAKKTIGLDGDEGQRQWVKGTVSSLASEEHDKRLLRLEQDLQAVAEAVRALKAGGIPVGGTEAMAVGAAEQDHTQGSSPKQRENPFFANGVNRIGSVSALKIAATSGPRYDFVNVTVDVRIADDDVSMLMATKIVRNHHLDARFVWRGALWSAKGLVVQSFDGHTIVFSGAHLAPDLSNSQPDLCS